MKSTKLDTPVFYLLSVYEYQEDKILKGGGYKFEVFWARITYIYFYLLYNLSKLVEKTRFGTMMILREKYILKLFVIAKIC